MSEMKAGDRVKFLNASGGGIITKVIDSRTVAVMIEDGFEIPTMISELVKIQSGDPAGRFFEEHYPLPDKPEKSPAEEPEDERLTSLPASLISGRKNEEIYLAFVPHDQKWLITGNIDVLLVNNSSWDVLYNIFSRNALGHFQGLDYGSIFPDTSLMVQTINREQLTHWTDGCIQFLFHRDQCPDVIPPFNAEFRIDGKRFFKEGNYKPHHAIKDKGIVIRLMSITDQIRATGMQDIKDAVPEKAALPDPSGQPLILKHQTVPGEAEIDLHIHELVEDPVNLESHEILEFQKNYFIRCMESARVNGFRKVVAIHGVGNGVLKQVLTSWLDGQVGITYAQASMAKYGLGALMIQLSRTQ